ncbi:hypothetical protein [Streptomyces sp. SAS_270]|uniref:hypothetical protein n=1 Tax=Streptomyces sp. SAS_270 TaxID=3412748 RepID=UPI00403C58CE
MPAPRVPREDQHPYAIVPGTRVVQALVPASVREDPLLSAVIDDRLDTEVREEMAGQSAAAWLPRRHLTATVVGPAAWPMQIVALMTRKDAPIGAVVEHDGAQPTLIGAVTTDTLIEYVIGGP